MEILFWTSVATVFYVYAGYPLLLAVWCRLAPTRILLPGLKPGPAGNLAGLAFPGNEDGSLRRSRALAGASLDESGALRRNRALARASRDEQVEFASVGPASVADPWGALAVAHESESPGVSIVIAARNEAPRLRARVENLLLQNYDGDIEIIVVSDGSTDNPRSVLDGLPGNVRLIEVPAGGKATALNAGVAEARHEILVFADARQTFSPDALRYLVAPLVDPHVGGVSGELVLDSESGDAAEHQRAPEHESTRAPEHVHPRIRLRSQTMTSELRRDLAEAPSHRPRIAEGVGLYWRYEKALRRMESAVGSTLGATGAIYALRKSLWRPLPPDTILDDVLAPMRAVLAGYTVVFEGRAKAYDRASGDAATESRRKVRTLAGNVQILWLEPRLLLPARNPVWLQYLSHKVGRLLVPYFLMLLLIASAILAPRHWFYEFALMAQLAFYALALWGTLLADRVARLAWTFVVLNYSAVAGAVAAVTRRKVWR